MIQANHHTTHAIERPLAATMRPQLEEHLKTIAASGDVSTLVGLFDAYLHIAETIDGSLNNPRLRGGEEAEELLTAEYQRMFDMAEAVIHELEKMSSGRTPHDVDLRTAALVRWDLECGSNPEGIVATLRKAAALPASTSN